MFRLEFGITTGFGKPFSSLRDFKHPSYGMISRDFLYLITTAFSIINVNQAMRKD